MSTVSRSYLHTLQSVYSKANEVVHSRLIQNIILIAAPMLIFSSWPLKMIAIAASIAYGYAQWPRLQLEFSVIYHSLFEFPKKSNYITTKQHQWTFYQNQAPRSIFTSIRFHTDYIATHERGGTIFLGALPTHKQGEWLAKQNVTHVFSLVEDWEIQKVPTCFATTMKKEDWIEKEIEFHSFPHLDGTLLEDHALLEITEIAQKALVKGQSIFVHCQAGKARSAQAVLAIIAHISKDTMTVNEVAGWIKQARPQVMLEEKRRERIENFMESSYKEGVEE